MKRDAQDNTEQRPQDAPLERLWRSTLGVREYRSVQVQEPSVIVAREYSMLCASYLAQTPHSSRSLADVEHRPARQRGARCAPLPTRERAGQ